MSLRDQGDPLTFLSVRLAQALEAAGDEGLGPVEIDDLDIPMLGWRLNELRSAGYVIGEQHGCLFLVHRPAPDDGAASTGPSAPAGSAPPAASDPSRAAGGPVDAACRRSNQTLLEAA